jgi:site-specific recombinase XerD
VAQHGPTSPENTVKAHGVALSHFVQFCQEAGVTMPLEISFRHVEFFMGLQLERGRAATTVN